MLTLVFAFALAAVLAFIGAAGCWGALRQIRQQLRDTQLDRDILRQEVQLLTDALARGNRTPIMRDPAKQLTKLETWYEGRSEVTRLTAGKGEG